MGRGEVGAVSKEERQSVSRGGRGDYDALTPLSVCVSPRPVNANTLFSSTSCAHVCFCTIAIASSSSSSFPAGARFADTVYQAVVPRLGRRLQEKLQVHRGSVRTDRLARLLA